MQIDASSNSTIVKMIKDILKFETDIFNMTLLPENERSNGTTEYVKMTLDELKKNYSYFDWEEYINYLRGTPINATATTIIIEDIKFLKNLKYLLNSTEKIIQLNYITWKHYQRKYKIFHHQLNSDDCVNIMIKELPIAMGAIYYQNYVDNSIKDDVLQIILDIKNQYSDMIINSYWIDDMTKKKAIEKLESLKYFFECPKEFLNNSIIDKFYGRLKFSDSDNYIDQSIQVDVFNRKYLLTHKNENFSVLWVLFMLKYNACYFRTYNIIALPPVYQNVLFKKNNLNAINYGLIGGTIGHDANGIRNNWWRNDSLQNFNDRAMCMVEQYGNYTMPEINANVNGTLTLGENIADNSGLKAAYHAYIKKLKSSSEGERLPGLDYNSKQLFWISYANKWCEKVTIEGSKSVLLDSHAPSEFRVIGPLSNMKEFSIDFQCPIGSKMNPIKKCTVW
ncbi:neprilysin-11-like [Aphidius gifuensis]|uniref:neprilysin-11-like n=1 Tax=Aphidius gifuensis TaxID=684658 RepID=UPI001CDCA8DD|nr:neprilysin-11-like [Aphidius gifuensis]